MRPSIAVRPAAGPDPVRRVTAARLRDTVALAASAKSPGSAFVRHGSSPGSRCERDGIRETTRWSAPSPPLPFGVLSYLRDHAARTGSWRPPALPLDSGTAVAEQVRT